MRNTTIKLNGAGKVSRTLFTAAAALVTALAFGVLVMGCPSDSSSGKAVTLLALDNYVTAPMKGAAPDTSDINEAQYTGTVAWKDGAGKDVTGNFTPDTAYKALVTLKAKSGYTFSGVKENSFTYTGASVTNAKNSGEVTITFPKTAAEALPTTVNHLSLAGR